MHTMHLKITQVQDSILFLIFDKKYKFRLRFPFFNCAHKNMDLHKYSQSNDDILHIYIYIYSLTFLQQDRKN